MRSCYDEGKRTAETLTMDYHRGAQVEVSVQYRLTLLFRSASFFTWNEELVQIEYLLSDSLIVVLFR